MFSPAAAVLLLFCITLRTTPGARAFVAPCPQTMPKQTESRHAAAASVVHQARGDENADGGDRAAAQARLGVEGLGELASQYDAFLVGEVGTLRNFDQASVWVQQ